MLTETQSLQLLELIGLPNVAKLFTAGVFVLLAKNPSATDQELLSEDEGSLKHRARKHIGFLVDLVWPEISPYLDQVLTQAIAQVRAITGQADTSLA